jgi:hypothetical protein
MGEIRAYLLARKDPTPMFNVALAEPASIMPCMGDTLGRSGSEVFIRLLHAAVGQMDVGQAES